MDLLAVADFNAVATHGGFSAASRAIGTPKATLSRRVRDLESELGVRLLERGTRSLRLTEEGRLLRSRTIHLLADLTDIGEEISGRAGSPRGVLKISAPGLFANTTLGKIAADFRRAYPEVMLEITVDDRFVDPVMDDFDIVVRVNPEISEDLVGHCFLRDQLVVAAHPDVPMPKADGETTPAIVLTAGRDPSSWTLRRDDAVFKVEPQAVMRCSSMVLVRGAVLAGAGAAIMPRHLVAPEIATGALVMWGELVGREVSVWALHTSKRLQSPKVKVFIETLLAAYAPRHTAEGAVVEGVDPVLRA
ncbi:MAG TPA: LysR family transcriptional regulator [Devosia sp.]|nr:LysR family transcriptional regulator [Devosia sp.]